MNPNRLLSDTPVRDGDRFCAPACGNGCLHSDYLLAKQKAAEMAADLGPGWEPNVYESLGWHYSAKSEAKEVHPDSDGYWADLWAGDDQYHAEGATPREALANAQQNALHAANAALTLVPGELDRHRVRMLYAGAIGLLADLHQHVDEEDRDRIRSAVGDFCNLTGWECRRVLGTLDLIPPSR